jgi:hypothetical protein
MADQPSSQIIDYVEPEEDTLPAETDEEIRVRAWRYEQFTRLGFDAVASARLAHEPVDLNVARRLVGNGCPLGIAVEILL